MKLKGGKPIVFLIAALLIIQVCGIPSLGAGKHWADEYVIRLSGLESVKQYLVDNQTALDLDKQMTRGEFIGLILSASNIEPQQDISTRTAIFADIRDVPNKLVLKVLETYKNGNLGGIPVQGKLYLGWNWPLTRQDAVTIAGRLCKLSSLNEVTYSDKGQMAVYAYPYIAAFCENGITSMPQNKQFRPKAYISRGEALAITSNMIDKGYLSPDNVEDIAGSMNGFKDGEGPQAKFFNPMGLAVDDSGNIVIIDSNNNLVRGITKSVVQTIAGIQKFKYDNYRIPIGGLVNGSVNEARFNKPQFAAIGTNGEIYVTDTGNNVVRVISGGTVKTLDTGKTVLNGPTGIAADKNGNLYIADTFNHCIRFFNIKTSEMSIFSGSIGKAGLKDGPAGDALFNEPVGLAVGKDNSIYITDSGNQRIRKISNGVVSTIAGSGKSVLEGTAYIEGGFADGLPNQSMFNFPAGICIDDDGIIYVADTGNHRIRAITEKKVVTVAGNGEAGYLSGMPRSASFNQPTGVLAYKGRLYVTDSFNAKVRNFRINTKLLK